MNRWSKQGTHVWCRFPIDIRGRELSDTAGDDVMAVNDDEKFGPWARPVVQVPHEYGNLMKSHCFFSSNIIYPMVYIWHILIALEDDYDGKLHFR